MILNLLGGNKSKKVGAIKKKIINDYHYSIDTLIKIYVI